MSAELGILFALGALLFWGIGDFLLQRTTRKIGDWETILVITIFGAVVTLPLVYNDLLSIASISDKTLILLIGVSCVLLVTAILDFEALKKGKIAVVEPVLALEVPVTAILAFAVINEGLAALEILLIAMLVIGIVLVSLKSRHIKKVRSFRWLERGVILTIVAAILLGTANFLVGFTARITTPLLVNWFTDAFIAAMSVFYFVINRKTGKVVLDFRRNYKLILTVSFFDNFAWIFFAFAVLYIPIAVAIALSESYIALAALLGLFINREILMRHQKIGLVTALGGAIALSIIVL